MPIDERLSADRGEPYRPPPPPTISSASASAPRTCRSPSPCAMRWRVGPYGLPSASSSGRTSSAGTGHDAARCRHADQLREGSRLAARSDEPLQLPELPAREGAADHLPQPQDVQPVAVEYNDYLSWAAEHFAESVSYGEAVETIRPETRDGRLAAFVVEAERRFGCTPLTAPLPSPRRRGGGRSGGSPALRRASA